MLRAPNGEPLGTLCVIDSQPRPEGLSEQQLSCLQALARQVSLIMDQRKAISTRDAALKSSRTEAQLIHNRALISEAATELLRSGPARMRAALEAGQVGTFDVDIAADVLYCSTEMCRIFDFRTLNPIRQRLSPIWCWRRIGTSPRRPPPAATVLKFLCGIPHPARLR